MQSLSCFGHTKTTRIGKKEQLFWLMSYSPYCLLENISCGLWMNSNSRDDMTTKSSFCWLVNTRPSISRFFFSNAKGAWCNVERWQRQFESKSVNLVQNCRFADDGHRKMVTTFSTQWKAKDWKCWIWYRKAWKLFESTQAFYFNFQ